MNAQPTPVSATRAANLAGFFIEAESSFYIRYTWCLNPYPQVLQVIKHLRSEVEQLGAINESWHLEEAVNATAPGVAVSGMPAASLRPQ